jgi:hypothetical protein
VGVEPKADEGIAAIAFGARAEFEDTRQDEAAREPSRGLLARIGHHNVGGTRRSIVVGAKTLGLDDHGPGGETVEPGSAFLFTHHIADEAHATAGEPAKFFRILEPAISDGAVEFSEREVGNAFRCRRERGGRRGGLQRGEREFRLG